MPKYKINVYDRIVDGRSRADDVRAKSVRSTRIGKSVCCVRGRERERESQGREILYVSGSIVDFEGIDGGLYRIARNNTRIASSEYKQRYRYESSG